MLLEERNKDLGDFEASDGHSDIPAAISDTGCERDLNEDRYAVIDSRSGLAWLVCDGMGGAAGGELAAQLAIDAIRRDLENLPRRPPDVALRSAIQEANRVIVLRRQNQAFCQMGTTIVAAIFDGLEVVIGHVGDSRSYLIRDGAIQQLSIDHTYVQQLVDEGQIRADEALSHPQAHILTRCIGAEPALEIDMQRYWIWEVKNAEPKDYLLLCSDGLYSLMAEGELANIVSQETPQNACVKLVELAKSRGGYDNITLAIIPLGGQMRQDPPPGYVERQTARPRRKVDFEQDGAPRNLWKFGLMVAMLSVLAALVTVLVVTFVVAR